MPDRTKTALTTAQQQQLRALRAAGALGRDTGVSIYTLQAAGFANPNVIGILRDKGLTDSRARRTGGSAWTDYWLTDAGAAQVHALEQAADHG